MPLVHIPVVLAIYFRREIRRVCAKLRDTVTIKYAGYENIAIGAFIFLRFLNPAITVPESYGLLARTQ